MTVNTLKFKSSQSKRTFLNNSIINARKLNKSRSLLQNSILRCTLKSNNSELAKNLAAKEEEIGELRKENNRLLKENFDITHNGQFRAYNYESFMTKFYELSENTISLFNEVSKLSDSVLALQYHPFVADKNSSINNHQSDIIPSPFVSRDKLVRSPGIIQNATDAAVLNLTRDNLGPQIQRLKDQSAQSIHNISENLDVSFHLKPYSRCIMNDISRHDQDEKVYIGKSVINRSISPTKRSSSTISLRKKMKSFENADDIQPTKKVKISKQMFSTDKLKMKVVRRKKNVFKKVEECETYDKSEYNRKKHEDVFYLSQNETINATIIPPTLHEFKGQLDKQIAKKSVHETKDNEISERNTLQPDTIMPESNLIVLQPLPINVDDDDDDFIVNIKPKRKQYKAQSTKKKSTKKSKNALDVSPAVNKNDGIMLSDAHEVKEKSKKETKVRSKKKISKDVIGMLEISEKKLGVVSKEKENEDQDDSKPVLTKKRRMPRVNYYLTPPKTTKKKSVN